MLLTVGVRQWEVRTWVAYIRDINNVIYGRFPFMLPPRRRYREMVMLMERLATSQCSNEDRTDAA